MKRRGGPLRTKHAAIGQPSRTVRVACALAMATAATVVSCSSARAPTEREPAVGADAPQTPPSRQPEPAQPEPEPEPEPQVQPSAEASSPPAVTPPSQEGRCSEMIEPGDGRRFVRHKIAPRETIAQVAHRYDVTQWQLREWNDLDPDVKDLRRGTRLRIKANRIPPPRKKIEYTVQDGDTWWRVAVAHGVDSMDLRAYNWPHRGKMSPGKTLKIWVDPVVYEWIQSVPDGLFDTEAGVVRPGAIGRGPPNGGRLINGIRIPPSNAYRLRFPRSAYGTTHAVSEFLDAMDRFSKSRPDARPLAIGAMSRQRGGRLGSHQSHQTGRDLDVSLPRRPGIPDWYTLKPSRVDWPAVWDLVRAFAASDVEVIFLERRMQRRLRKAAKEAGASEEERQRLLGLVRHADGHDKHMHVRFRCGPCEVECVDNTVRGEDGPP